MNDVDYEIETIMLDGFDPDGDPEIRRMKSGKLFLVFNFMPPSWIAEDEYGDLGRCKEFDRELENAIGTPVKWVDREFFLIEKPFSDTIELIKQFLAEYRLRNDGGHSTAFDAAI